MGLSSYFLQVEIQVELEEEETKEEQPVFDFDPFDTVVGQEHDSSDLSDVDDEEDEGGNDFSDLSSDGGGGPDDETPLEIPMNMKHIQDMVKKLDAILSLLFEHFQRLHAIASTHSAIGLTSKSTSRSPLSSELCPLPPLPPLPSESPLPLVTPDQTVCLSESPFTAPNAAAFPPRVAHTMRTQFNALLSIFDRIILRTFKSRYTQFLMFWYTSLDPEFADVFQGMLVERAILGSSSMMIQPAAEAFNESDGRNNRQQSTITRAAAASYIGSFVSRAVFVDVQSTRNVVAVLCEFLKAHLNEVEELIRNGFSTIIIGGGQHAVFYAVVQAVFLIFCFRWRDLLDCAENAQTDHITHSTGVSCLDEFRLGENSRKWMPELGVLQRAINSVLNPLRVCDQFAGCTLFSDSLGSPRFVRSMLLCNSLVWLGRRISSIVTRSLSQIGASSILVLNTHLDRILIQQ